MMLAAATLALLALVQATPVPSNTITYQDLNGNMVTENLDQPIAQPYAVDINKLHFMLYTVKNKAEPQELKVGNTGILSASNFSPKRKTKICIHGWQNNYKMEAAQTLKDAYLAHDDVNVLLVDYEAYNSPYLSAVSNNKQVGEHIGKMMAFLVSNGANPADFHLLGHSLGAHIAGNACRSQPSMKVGRVTGLDPAGPMFNGQSDGSRLSKSDANIVECIHTSTEFGMTNPCGTHDYYVNGGGNQPSCSHASMTGGCDHSASFRYWAQAISDPTVFSVLKCNSVSDAQSVTKAPSACAKAPGNMGEVGTSVNPGIYFVPV